MKNKEENKRRKELSIGLPNIVTYGCVVLKNLKSSTEEQKKDKF